MLGTFLLAEISRVEKFLLNCFTKSGSINCPRGQILRSNADCKHCSDGRIRNLVDDPSFNFVGTEERLPHNVQNLLRFVKVSSNLI